jgi:hypothetical protein
MFMFGTAIALATSCGARKLPAVAVTLPYNASRSQSAPIPGCLDEGSERNSVSVECARVSASRSQNNCRRSR